MNIVICDDDEFYRTKLEYIISGILINNSYNSDITLSTDKAEDILEYIQNDTSVTLYFLDISLGGNVSGIDIASEIRKNDTISTIVLITNYADNIALTYEYKLKIHDFIVKSNMDKCEERIKQSIIYAEQRQQDGYLNCANIYNYAANISVPYDKIYYIDTISGSHKLVMHTETSLYEFYGKIKELVNELDGNFLKCHKSVIVNKNKIIGVDKKARNIILLNGYTCPYSARLFNPDEIYQYNGR